MLNESKIIDTIDGKKTVEFRTGTGGRGETIYIIVSYLGNGYNRSYHEERFSCMVEAQSWYDNAF